MLFTSLNQKSLGCFNIVISDFFCPIRVATVFHMVTVSYTIFGASWSSWSWLSPLCISKQSSSLTAVQQDITTRNLWFAAVIIAIQMSAMESVAPNILSCSPHWTVLCSYHYVGAKMDNTKCISPKKCLSIIHEKKTSLLIGQGLNQQLQAVLAGSKVGTVKSVPLKAYHQ